jgi:predicted DsbA family dithiol-disulfide isomerase
MAECARDRGDDMFWATHRAIFAAYFGHGRDIGSREVLLDVARSCGLDTGLVTGAWDERIYDDRLRGFAELARQLGITTTPAALICNELLIGTRPYGVLREAVERCLVTPATLDGESRAAGGTDG